MRWFALIAFLALGAGRGKADDPLAVVVRVDGNVTLDQATPRNQTRSPSRIRRARFLQVMGAGDEIHIPPAAKAEVVCSSDHWLPLTEGVWRLRPDLCQKGQPLPPGAFLGLAPSGGRMRSLKGALVLERDTRTPGNEVFGAPTLLSPRNTAILEARPTILWTAVSEATEYEIELVGPGAFRITLDAAQVECEPVQRWWERAVCTSPWPAAAADLVRGEPVFLTVGAKLGLGSPLRKEEGAGRITRLSERRASEVKERVERLQDLPIDIAARLLLEADIYCRFGILSKAISVYTSVSVLKSSPEVWTTLGDAYLATGLLRLAVRSYQAVLEAGSDLVSLAGAEFGLGKVESERRNYRAAQQHFERAGEIFLNLGMKEQAVRSKQASREMANRR